MTVALVTGASGAIGSACAAALAEDGARVAIGFFSNKEGALETASNCAGSHVVQIDTRDAEAVSAAFDEVEHALGPVEILVNNAGITRDRLLLRMSEDDWHEVIETNLSGAFRCTKRALPKMLKSGWGRVVNVGSVVGSAGNPGQANYAASKAGLIGFTKSLAREVARHGITVNVVAPGLVDSDLTSVLPDSARSALLERIPMGRPAGADEVAEAVRFCARSGYLTGQVIHIDGGLT
jgi:3-oxoacyl-[acyl-carrier protein] reductase